MVEIWSNLLISASSDRSAPPRFVHIIGELNARQAKLFMDVATKGFDRNQYDMHGIVFEMQQQYIEERLKKVFKRKKLKADNFYDELMSDFEGPCVALSDLIVSASNDDSWSVLADENKFGKPEVQADLQVLESLGLFRNIRISQQRQRRGINEVTVLYFLLTEMGCDFFEAVSPAPSNETS